MTGLELVKKLFFMFVNLDFENDQVMAFSCARFTAATFQLH